MAAPSNAASLMAWHRFSMAGGFSKALMCASVYQRQPAMWRRSDEIAGGYQLASALGASASHRLSAWPGRKLPPGNGENIEEGNGNAMRKRK